MKAGTRLADDIPIGTWAFMDMFPKDNRVKSFLGSTDL